MDIIESLSLLREQKQLRTCCTREHGMERDLILSKGRCISFALRLRESVIDRDTLCCCEFVDKTPC